MTTTRTLVVGLVLAAMLATLGLLISTTPDGTVLRDALGL